MAGWVTNTRVASHDPIAGEWWRSGVPVERGTYNFIGPTRIPVPSQTTNSWRSGGESPDLLPTDDMPKTSAAATEMFRRRYLAKGPHRPYDTGHTFETTRNHVRLNCPFVNILGTAGYSYTGPYVVQPESVPLQYRVYPPKPLPLNTGWYQSEAIKRTVPTKSVANLAVALSELYRDGLPSIIGLQTVRSSSVRDKITHGQGLADIRGKTSRSDPFLRVDVASLTPASRSAQLASTIRGGASDHLNAQFGVKPLLSDILGLCEVVIKSNNLIRQYRRDSGRIVRRGTSFPVTQETLVPFSNRPAGATFYSHTGNLSTISLKNGGVGSASCTDITTRRTWFTGAYSYFLSEDDSSVARMRGYEEQARYLLGLSMTPEVLWNLVPWTWLIDWFSNLGTLVSNATALSQDGLVIRWGYLMEESVREYTTTLSGFQTQNSGWEPSILTLSTVNKRRTKASPYGFGQNPSQFTARQWSILAALGLTRAPRIAW